MKPYAIVLDGGRIIHQFDTATAAREYCTRNNSAGWLIVKVIAQAVRKPVEFVEISEDCPK